MYETAVDQLTEAHSEIEAQIARFGEATSAAMAFNDALYSNIEYPLSSTLCHNEKHPRATIASHLEQLHQRLHQAREALLGLSNE